ncbi:MAG: PAS domain-containing protein [Pseudomonadota bacterium]
MSLTYHPNTITLLTAWERMTQAPDIAADLNAAKASDYPDLLDCLFVIQRAAEGRWLFRNAGDQLSQLLGRDLGDHDCMDFWTGHDRAMVRSLIDSVRESRKPGILHASGETLTGKHVGVELTFAPLPITQSQGNTPRLLGLYQLLQPRVILNGRPVWRHRVTAIYPPSPDRQATHLRLVASND